MCQILSLSFVGLVNLEAIILVPSLRRRSKEIEEKEKK